MGRLKVKTDSGFVFAGVNGAPGNNGISPTVTITAITGGHRVTITDATGTKTFDVMDGEDGEDASVTVDSALSTTSTNPIQNKAVAQKFASLEDAFSESVEGVVDQIPVIDTSISKAGYAADAGAVGAAIEQAMEEAGQALDMIMGAIPTETSVYAWIDDYLSEALGGDY